MNLALCYPSVFPAQGGCETYIASLARRLVRDGHEVHLYACRWDSDALPPAMHFHRISLPRCPRFARAWLFSRRCSRLLQKARHDLSLGFDKIAGVDVYYPQGGEYPAAVRLSQDKYPSLLGSALRWVRQFDPTHQTLLALEREQLAHRGGLVLALSDMVRRHLLARTDVQADSLRVLPIAAMPDRLVEDDRAGRRQRFRRRWQIAENEPLALFAGMNLRLKGLETLLRALTHLADTPLTVAVAGAEPSAWFHRLVQRLGVGNRVRFVGYTSDMRDPYFAADMLVHPTFYDPCATVVLEALACGLPVITTTRNGACEQMRRLDGAGTCAEGYLLDNPHDDQKLASFMRLLTDPLRQQRCAGAARRAAAWWTFEHHYQGLLGLLSDFQTRRKPVVLHRFAA